MIDLNIDAVQCEENATGETGLFLLPCSVSFANGKITAVELGVDRDIYIKADGSGYLTRMKSDREKTPNWPHPES